MDLKFYQLDIDVQGKLLTHSGWGVVLLSYTPPPAISYFNLTLEGNWVVSNMPLISGVNSRRRCTERFFFPLGTQPGIQVRQLRVGFRVARRAIRTGPVVRSTHDVKPLDQRLYSAFVDGRMTTVQPTPQRGGGVRALFCRLNYPNQPCGENECCPAAVSNSLQWLKKSYKLDVPDSELTIARWKDILAWQPGGTRHGAWADKKAALFADPRNHLPFTSEKFNKAQIARVYDRFQAGCAVELDLGDHVVSITCMGPSTDGSYTIKAASDTKQNGAPTGQAVETLKLDIDGNCLDGPNWAKGRVVQNFVVQCRR